MITAIIEARQDEVGLAHALAALVPAATEGVVRDVIVIDRASDVSTALVADAAGCTLIDATRHDDAERAAVDEARGDWLLFLPQQTLPPEWQEDALAFIDRAMVAGRAQRQVAVFRGGRLPTGPIAWLRAMLRGGSPARLVAKSAWLAEQPRGAMRLSAVSSVSGARRGAA
jgi:hypothetical protein